MKSVLIDIFYLSQKYNIDNLLSYLNPLPIETNGLGVVIVVNNIVLDTLKTIEQGKKRVKYLNSRNFIDSISDFGFIFYDESRKQCILDSSCIGMVDYIVNSTMRYLPNTITLVAYPIHDSYKQELSHMLFKNHGNVMVRINDLFIDEEEIDDIESGYFTKSLFCDYKFKFTTSAINYLKTLPYSGTTHNEDGSLTQKEFAGTMKTILIDENNVHHLAVEKIPNTGGSGDVSLEVDLITFHSHPESAYENAKVNIGSPSLTDYITFLSVIENVTVIMTIVVAIEGMYIISIPPEWILSGKKYSSKIKDVIEKSKLTEKRSEVNPIQHSTGMSQLSIDGIRFVNVQFVSWSKSNSIISLVYSSENQICKIPKK